MDIMFTFAENLLEMKKLKGLLSEDDDSGVPFEWGIPYDMG